MCRSIVIFNMKKIIVLLFVIVFATSLTAQERVNRERKSFEMSSEKITSATGWAYNETRGEWIDTRNRICLSDMFSCSYSRCNSFNYIQVRTITFDKLYYVIIFDETHGAYRYPRIMEEWYEYKAIRAIVIDETNFHKLMNPGNDVTEIIGFNPSPIYDIHTTEDLIIYINNIMASQTKRSTTKIAIYQTQDNKYIRFYKASCINCTCETERISNQYFELPVDEWHKLQNFE